MLNILVTVHHDLRRLQEAVELLERAIEGRCTTLGSEHPATLRVLRVINTLNRYTHENRRTEEEIDETSEEVSRQTDS